MRRPFCVRKGSVGTGNSSAHPEDVIRFASSKPSRRSLSKSSCESFAGDREWPLHHTIEERLQARLDRRGQGRRPLRQTGALPFASLLRRP